MSRPFFGEVDPSPPSWRPATISSWRRSPWQTAIPLQPPPSPPLLGLLHLLRRPAPTPGAPTLVPAPGAPTLAAEATTAATASVAAMAAAVVAVLVVAGVASAPPPAPSSSGMLAAPSLPPAPRLLPPRGPVAKLLQPLGGVHPDVAWFPPCGAAPAAASSSPAGLRRAAAAASGTCC